MSEVPAPASDKPQHLEATRALCDVVADAEKLRGHPRRLQRALELLSTLASRSARDTLRHSRADITRIRRELGYEPSVSFEEGLERTLAWYRSQAGA